jgi:diguanylate cyclase (GGDEF)-like protein/PAS domain S-box-containing protein
LASVIKTSVPQAPDARTEPRRLGLLDSAPFGVALLDHDLKLIDANAACDVFLPAEWRLRPALIITGCILGEDQTTFSMLAMRNSLGQTAESAEIRFRRRDGGVIWMLANISPTSDAGRAAGIAHILQLTNIDRQKRLESEIKISEERWNSALVSSNLGVWDHNFRTQTYYYSDNWRALRGYGPDDEMLTSLEDWIETVHPDDRAHVLESIHRQNSGEDRVSRFEYRERHKNGHWIWIECKGACIEWDQDGKPLRIVGTDTDISARRTAEEKLANVSRRLELALDVTKIGVFEADVDNGTLFWDDRMLAIFGVEGSPNLQDGESWQKMLHPDDAARARERIRTSTDSNQLFTNEFRIIRADGEIRHIRARVAPIPSASGKHIFVGANWDVTEDYRIREELERARELAEARNHELEEANAKIEHNALHDFLTQLPNRRFLDVRLAEISEECHQRACGLAVLHIDLDRFKQINDTLGHTAGDAMLKHAARVLTETIGPEDFVARIGGDEFVILSYFDGTMARLTQTARNIVRSMSEPVPFENHVCRMGASIGIATGNHGEVDAKQLLLNADIALYRAKNLGRNRHEFFSVEIQQQVFTTKRLSDEILTGLERGEFVPYYQLQFRASDLSIAGAETLARWNHPTRGLLTPDAFLAVANDLDVVGQIDRLILEQALADLERWEKNGIAVPKISVNVSSRRLSDPDLLLSLGSLGIEPGRVSFELLESIFLDDCDETALANLRRIRRLGIDVEIDDFGSGHASIISLLKIAPTTLKIDRQLIKGIPSSAAHRRLIRAIIEIGKSMRIKVVAEGVESPQHIAILRDFGCDILQGYGLARPMAFDAIGAFIRNGQVDQDSAPPPSSLLRKAE